MAPIKKNKTQPDKPTVTLAQIQQAIPMNIIQQRLPESIRGRSSIFLEKKDSNFVLKFTDGYHLYEYNLYIATSQEEARPHLAGHIYRYSSTPQDNSGGSRAGLTPAAKQNLSTLQAMDGGFTDLMSMISSPMQTMPAFIPTMMAPGYEAQSIPIPSVRHGASPGMMEMAHNSLDAMSRSNSTMLTSMSNAPVNIAPISIASDEGVQDQWVSAPDSSENLMAQIYGEHGIIPQTLSDGSLWFETGTNISNHNDQIPGQDDMV